MLSFPFDYLYLVALFKKVPKSPSLKHHLPWVSSLFVFTNGLKKPKEKTKTIQAIKKPPNLDEHDSPKISSIFHFVFSK